MIFLALGQMTPTEHSFRNNIFISDASEISIAISRQRGHQRLYMPIYYFALQEMLSD